MNLSKTKTIRISEEQHKTLVKMKSYNVDVGRFIREAIKEKINMEYSSMKPKLKKDFFQLSLERAMKQISIK
jgi:predicted CopG family antitoxin